MRHLYDKVQLCDCQQWLAPWVARIGEVLAVEVVLVRGGEDDEAFCAEGYSHA